ncbi:MAG: hypothetical protein IJH39_03580 [Clostridia bacterium]|nr:hypothetical protein [Clostridia bacterium]
MSNKKKIKLLLLNGAIVAINIVLFSNVFLGLSLFKGTALTLLAGWGAIVSSLVAFFGGNMKILKNEEIHLLAKDVESLDDCISVFEEAIYNGDVFDENIKKNIEQIKRFKRKYNTINDILLQKFSAEEMTYQKFSDVLKEVEKVIYINMRSIINKISAFDMEEYENILKNKIDKKMLPKEKLDIYEGYINFVNEATNTNEEILLKLDKMILEISKYNSIDGGDIKNMPAIVEMDELIKNAKLYK